MKQTNLPFIKRLALVLLVLVTVFVIVLIVTDIRSSALPHPVLPIANTIFICLITLIAAILAGRTFLVSGSWPILLFGSGLWAYGAANLVAGWMPTSEQNVAVTVHNSSSLLAAFCFLLLAILIPRDRSVIRIPNRRWLLCAVYGLIVVFVGLLTALALQNKTELFFISGTGPTLLRQIILGSATILFSISAFYFLNLYRRSKADFLYWCSLGLGLIAVGFIAISFANVFGDTINWVGRLAQYLGCVYLGVAILIVIQETRKKELPVTEIIDDFLHNAKANYQLLVETTTDAIILADRQGRVLMWNQAAEGMFGYSSKEAVGELHLHQIISESDFPGFQKGLDNLSLTKERKLNNQILELKAHRKNGESFPVEISFSAGKSRERQVETLTLVIRDTTERKKAESRILESESRYRATLESVTDAFVSIDRQWRYTYANETATKILYKSREELLGHVVWEAFPDSPEVFNINLRQAMMTSTKVSFEVFYPTVNIWYECHCYPSPEGLSIFFSDITERKQAEKALLASKEKYLTLFNSIDEGFFLIDVIFDNQDKPVDLLYVEANATATRIVGQDYTGKRLTEISPNYEPYWFEIFGEVARTGHSIRLERYAEPDKKWYSFYVFKAGDANSRRIGNTFLDITERKKAEEALKESEEKYRNIVETASEGIWVCDTNALTIFVNQRLGDMLGYSQEEMLGKPAYYFMDQEAKDLAKYNLERRMQGNKDRYEQKYIRKDGTVLWAIASASPILDKSGKVVASLGMLADVTERKKAEQVLQKYIKELETANKELEAFSYSVSHDLRQPLRALDSFSEITILDYADKLDETGKSNLNRIRKASQTMSQLIDDILKLSRITRVEMHLEKVNLSEIVKTIEDELKTSHPERQVEIMIESGIVVKGDKNLLQIGLMNLLDNAWKFTGKCEAAKIVFGQTQQNGESIFFIKDNGIGFDMRYRDKLFQPFQRLHTQKDYSGTGVGLAIVQRVVRRHNGRIWAESEPGKGTTFYFTLG